MTKPSLRFMRNEHIEDLTTQRIRQYEAKVVVKVGLPVPGEEIIEQVLGLNILWDTIQAYRILRRITQGQDTPEQKSAVDRYQNAFLMPKWLLAEAVQRSLGRPGRAPAFRHAPEPWPLQVRRPETSPWHARSRRSAATGRASARGPTTAD